MLLHKKKPTSLFVSPSDFTSISRGVLSGRGEFTAAAAFLTGNSGTTGFVGPTEACPRGSSAARSLAYLWWHGLEWIKGRARSIHRSLLLTAGRSASLYTRPTRTPKESCCCLLRWNGLFPCFFHPSARSVPLLPRPLALNLLFFELSLFPLDPCIFQLLLFPGSRRHQGARIGAHTSILQYVSR